MWRMEEKGREERRKKKEKRVINENVLEQLVSPPNFSPPNNTLTLMSFAQEELLGRSKIVMLASIPITYQVLGIGF